MFCKKCGNKLPIEAEFCNKCGARSEAGSAKRDSKTYATEASADQTPVEYGGKVIIKCGNCGYVGAGEPARTITGKVLAWLCIFIAWPITLIYFLATHKYRCPKCKSTFLGVKNEEGVFVGQRGGSGKWLTVVIVAIVGIAVVAILAAIVLVNVTSYINKGKDAATKGNLSTIMANGAVYYNSNSSYTDFCTSNSMTTPEAAITSAGGALIKNCNDRHFCACSDLKIVSGDTYCVDDTGYGKETSTACSARCGYLGSCSD
jgi:Tfp pilus assembly protein PilE/ribosomal protein L40E